MFLSFGLAKANFLHFPIQYPFLFLHFKTAWNSFYCSRVLFPDWSSGKHQSLCRFLHIYRFARLLLIIPIFVVTCCELELLGVTLLRNTYNEA